jgi:hypothetical protein
MYGARSPDGQRQAVSVNSKIPIPRWPLSSTSTGRARGLAGGWQSLRIIVVVVRGFALVRRLPPRSRMERPIIDCRDRPMRSPINDAE